MPVRLPSCVLDLTSDLIPINVPDGYEFQRTSLGFQLSGKQVFTFLSVPAESGKRDCLLLLSGEAFGTRTLGKATLKDDANGRHVEWACNLVRNELSKGREPEGAPLVTKNCGSAMFVKMAGLFYAVELPDGTVTLAVCPEHSIVSAMGSDGYLSDVGSTQEGVTRFNKLLPDWVKKLDGFVEFFDFGEIVTDRQALFKVTQCSTTGLVARFVATFDLSEDGSPTMLRYSEPHGEMALSLVGESDDNLLFSDGTTEVKVSKAYFDRDNWKRKDPFDAEMVFAEGSYFRARLIKGC